MTDKAYEQNFEFENRPYQFIDLETGEKVKLQSNQVKEYYQKRIKEKLDELRMKCLQYHIDFIDADVNSKMEDNFLEFRKVLQAYLVKRNRMGV